jgi:uncharacterized protein
MRFELYENAVGGWRWRVRANNNCLIAWSGESYSDKLDCLNAINLVRAAAIHDPVQELVQEAVRRVLAAKPTPRRAAKPMVKAS